MYTSEVLAVVMQQLMEQSPLPMLLMRTVIQSLTMYPRLGGFVMNILSRLIMKQVTALARRGQLATLGETPSLTLLCWEVQYGHSAERAGGCGLQGVSPTATQWPLARTHPGGRWSSSG